MGISDSAKSMAGKAKDAISGHTDEVDEGVEKITDKADDLTGNKQTSNIDKGGNAAKDAVDKLGGNKK